MGRQKKDFSPGCIFTRNGKLYFKIWNKQYSTGLTESKEGRELAVQMKNEMYLQLLRNDGRLPNNQKQSIFPVFESYLNRLITRGRSRNTIRGYRLAFITLIPENILLSPVEIKNSVNKSINELLLANKVTLNTINIYVKKLQLFLNDCTKKGVLDKTYIVEDHKRPFTPKVVQPYSPQEYELIILESENPLKSKINRDHEFTLLMKFLYESGARIKETLGLRWSNIDFVGMTITFSNKVNPSRKDTIPISKKLLPILNELIDISKARIRIDDQAKVFRWGINSSSRLTKRLSIIEQSLGIKIHNQSFHRFRNSFSDRLSQANIPILIYSDLMRHKDYRTTLNHYRIPHIDKMRDAVDSI